MDVTRLDKPTMLKLLRRIANYKPKQKAYRPNKALFREPKEEPQSEDEIPEDLRQSDLDFLQYHGLIKIHSNAMEVFFSEEYDEPLDIVTTIFLTPVGRTLLVKGEEWEENRIKKLETQSQPSSENPIAVLENTEK